MEAQYKFDTRTKLVKKTLVSKISISPSLIFFPIHNLNTLFAV